MKPKTTQTNAPPFCGGCAHSRRAFITNCARCIGAGALSGLALPTMLASENYEPKNSTMKVRIIFILHNAVQVKPDWPNVGFDFNPVMEKITNALLRGCREIDFVQSMIDGLEKAEKLIAADQSAGDIDGYLIVQMNTGLPTQINQRFSATGKPVLYADFHYGGTGRYLQTTAQQLRSGSGNLAHMASDNFAHLAAAANCFTFAKGTGGVKAFVDGVTKIRKDIVARVQVDMKCLDDKIDMLTTTDLLKELKTKKMLSFERSNIKQQAKDTFGVENIECTFAELNDLWEKADRDQAQEIVKRWKNNATDIVYVSDETLEQSARMYLAQKQCLKNHDACALTINCLGGFYGGSIQAYPCLGFYELLNEGLIGACENDNNSTLTMIAMTTSLRMNPLRKEIVFHQAKSVGNIIDDRACRTKLAAVPVGDFEKLFTEWDRFGWHRVTYYGDLKQPVYALADAIGWTIIEET